MVGLLFYVPTPSDQGLDIDIGPGITIRAQGAVLNQAKQLIQQSEVIWAPA